jgi:hypothetical protein
MELNLILKRTTKNRIIIIKKKEKKALQYFLYSRLKGQTCGPNLSLITSTKRVTEISRSNAKL